MIELTENKSHPLPLSNLERGEKNVMLKQLSNLERGWDCNDLK